ncbi:MAG: ABC transporter permease [Alphaproteobacteria bacterium]|nr:ABC transporter permease [Alphaproteobacteria bacterium]
MGFYVVQFLTGLASAASLFLVASGLTIIFGVTRVVNFAHGSFYMLGAFIAYSLVKTLPLGPTGFWVGVVLAALAVGVIGVVMEVTILRRIYQAPELFQLVATFGVVMVAKDAALLFWGPEDRLGPRAPGLNKAIELFGSRVPEYDLVVIALGFVVLGLLWLLFNRTRWGAVVRAATQDREMLSALGINQKLLFTAVFFLGSVLAGLGGALQLPRASVSHQMDLSIIATVFVVVVLGGMGSIPGAFLAAVIISELSAFGILIFPKITLVLMFLVMVVVLVARPFGILGKPVPDVGEPVQSDETLTRLPSALGWAGYVAVVALLLAIPMLLSEFYLVLWTQVFIFALFAASLHFIMGGGGMVSFGHAAYFGLGGYGCAMLLVRAGLPMEATLLLAPVVAAAGAALFGYFCVRLSGVYMAMLSLAFAQIVWSVVFQWSDVTGGEDGVNRVWPSPWAKDRVVFYYLTLTLAAVGIFTLWRLLFAPFGYTLRAGRDSPMRAESIGIDIRFHRWLAFIISGAAAGVAGSLLALAKGFVGPTWVDIPRSIDALMMVLIGGVQTLVGPILGALTFVILEDRLSAFDYWRSAFGLIIILICVLMPKGIVGSGRALIGRLGLGGGGER